MRTVFAALLAATACVTVGAQSPANLDAPQRAELFRRNRLVVERLVEKTIESSRLPGNHVKRAESYYQVLVEFSTAIDRAKREKDVGRAEDLTRQLTSLLSKGLAPTLVDAKQQVEGGSGAAEYAQARDHLLVQVDALISILSDDPTSRATLEQARTDLMQKVGK